MSFEGFVFSDQTSELSDTEFDLACRIIDAAERAVDGREALLQSDAGAAVYSPDAGWHPDTQPSFEIDGATRNMMNSWELLRRRDRDIIRKLRLYGQAFTGYQLATLEFATKRPWIADKLPDDLDTFLKLCAGAPDQSVFDYVSVAGALPEPLRAAPPWKFGELGWLIDGTIVNYDTYSYLERLCLLYENGLTANLEALADDRTPLIVEIGGGYGALAYHLIRVLNQRARYIIVDLPESLAFAAIYCGVLLPDLPQTFAQSEDDLRIPDDPGITFVPNHLHPQLDPVRDVDLAINTLSLSEMSDDQIRDYCALVQRLIGRSGLFFEQNHQSDHLGPGGFLPAYFKNKHRCTSQLLPDSFPGVRGDANIWIGLEGAV